MLAVGVSGGAVYPSMQAAVGDKAGTQVSYMSESTVAPPNSRQKSTQADRLASPFPSVPFTGFFVLTACLSTSSSRFLAPSPRR